MPNQKRRVSYKGLHLSVRPGGLGLSYWGYRLGGNGSGRLAQTGENAGQRSLPNRPDLYQEVKTLDLLMCGPFFCVSRGTNM